MSLCLAACLSVYPSLNVSSKCRASPTLTHVCLFVAEDEEHTITAEIDSDVSAEKKRIHNTDTATLKSDNVLVAK